MLIGHQAQIDFLRRSWQAGKLVHGYLFVGPEAVGKKAAASQVANWVLERQTGPVDLSQDPQIKFIERTYDEKTGKKHKDISIKQIHETREYLAHHALISPYKVVIIDGAETMSAGASNALLKTLEEPSPRTLIILLTTNEKELLPTIVSRCQVLRFYQVPTKEIYKALTGQGANRSEALEISRVAHGSPGRALRMWKETERRAFYQREKERFWQVLKGDLSGRLAAVAQWFASKEDHMEARDQLADVLQIWQGLWRDILAQQSGAGELTANVSAEEEIKKHAQRFSTKKIAQVISQIEITGRLLRQNVNQRLLMENLILSFY